MKRVAFTFNAFGNDSKPEIVRHTHNGAQQRGFLWLVPFHKGPVDLDDIEWEARQIGERGIAGAKIVKRQADAHRLQAGKDMRGLFRVFHQDGFGQFEFQAARIEMNAGKHRTDIIDEILTDELRG